MDHSRAHAQERRRARKSRRHQARRPTNRNPRPEQLQPLEDVERSRRIHRNDLENIPAFLAIGLLFVAIAPPLAAAQWLMYGFVAARLLHTIAYSTAQRHEVRATFYSVGSLIVIAMAIWVLLVAAQANA
ncbi:MAG: MAPEG family protein [Hyphomonadaceae bacterium]|nr:MAPEG family protein [Hyphomonadaceae bacterium]